MTLIIIEYYTCAYHDLRMRQTNIVSSLQRRQRAALIHPLARAVKLVSRMYALVLVENRNSIRFFLRTFKEHIDAICAVGIF